MTRSMKVFDWVLKLSFVLEIKFSSELKEGKKQEKNINGRVKGSVDRQFD